MGYRLVPLLLLLVAGLEACGKEIGDSCSLSTDCSPNNDRLCIDPPGTPNSTWNGYCTIQGCDYSTCPEEAACVRFFTGSFSNKTCDRACDLVYGPQNLLCPAPVPPQVQCSLDEHCAVDDKCVARSSEIRYCMRTCDSDGDCRDGYECRDLDKMISDGGEPVLADGQVIDTDGQVIDLTQKGEDGKPKVVAPHPPKFCAVKPASP